MTGGGGGGKEALISFPFWCVDDLQMLQYLSWLLFG